MADAGVWGVITLAARDANAIDSPRRYGNIHASASTWRCLQNSIALGTPHDRPALLDHAEWPQDHDVSRRDGAEIQDFPGQYRQRRSVQAGVSGNRAEQPNSCDARSRAEGRRQADLDL